MSTHQEKRLLRRRLALAGLRWRRRPQTGSASTPSSTNPLMDAATVLKSIVVAETRRTCWDEETRRRVRKNDLALKELLLGGESIDDEVAVDMTESLRANTTITFLTLQGSKISAVGFSSLANVLCKNCTLTKLHLWKNAIGDAGVADIANALRQNGALTDLRLGSNGIDDAGAAALAISLQETSCLSSLELRENNIGDSGAAKIADAIQQNTTLKKLDLESNYVGDAGAEAFANALRRNVQLTRLDLAENKIRDEGAVKIADALCQNATLADLDLRANRFGYVGMTAFARTLHTFNTTVTTLRLTDKIHDSFHVSSHVQQLVEKNRTVVSGREAYGASVATKEGRVGWAPTLGRVAEELGESESRGEMNPSRSHRNNCLADPSNIESSLPGGDGPHRTQSAKAASSNQAHVDAEEALLGLVVSWDSSILPLYRSEYPNPDDSQSSTITTNSHQHREGRYAGLGTDEMSLLERVKEDYSTVASVNLCGKKIGNKGVELVATALRQNSCVKELRLDNSCIGDKGMVSLTSVILGNSTISKICLRRNKVTDKGAIALAASLSCNSSVTFLSLAENKVGFLGAKALARVLTTNDVVEELELDKNPIGTMGATEIASCLCSNSSLKVLKLDCCDIASRGAKEVAKSLHHNQTLAKLYLRRNKFSNDGAVAFIDAFHFNHSLIRLNLGGNNIDANTEDTIKRYLERNEANSTRPLTFEERNMITFLFSDPLVHIEQDGTTHPFPQRLSLQKDKETLFKCIRRTQKDIKVSFALATRARLRRFSADRCGCLHFSDAFLVFEDSKGSGCAEFLSRADVCRSLEGSAFNLVFVSACHSESIGRVFIEAGVNHVVCCENQSELNDCAATEFTDAFYHGVAKGFSVDKAFNEGKKAVADEYSEDEASKFLLLPENGEHNAPVFDAKQVEHQPELEADPFHISKMPPHFVGREKVMNKVLYALSAERFVTVTCERGMGRTSLVFAIRHHIDERRSTFLDGDDIKDTVFYVERDKDNRKFSSSFLDPLYGQLQDAGMVPDHLDNNGRGLAERICISLKCSKVLLIFDGVDGFEHEVCLFLRTLFEKTGETKVLLTGTRRTGFSSATVVERECVELEPLSRECSAELFARICRFADTADKRSRMSHLLLSVTSTDIHTRANESTSRIFQTVRQGIPASIIDVSQQISEDEYKTLLSDPLDGESAVRLFGSTCQHPQFEYERSDFEKILLSEISSDRVRKSSGQIVRTLHEGIPERIIQSAATLSNENYELFFTDPLDNGSAARLFRMIYAPSLVPDEVGEFVPLVEHRTVSRGVPREIIDAANALLKGDGAWLSAVFTSGE